MEKMNIHQKIINTIKFIYSHAKTQINKNTETININKGVLQGGILSPTLFNLYLTDLIDDLNKISNDVPTYADDIALILTRLKDVDKCIRIIHEWKIKNKIGLNSKKSALMKITKKRTRRTYDYH
jgi:hypothetical protein